MSFGYALAISIVLIVVVERIFIYVYVRRRKRRLSFGSYYLIGVYKPVLIALAITIYAYYRAENPLTIWIMAGLTLLTPLVSYPAAKFLYRRAQHTSAPGRK